MANRLGSMWLNRVSQLTGPTPTGRFSKFALLVPRINALEPVFEPLTDDELKHRSHELRLRAQPGRFAQHPAGRGLRTGPGGGQADNRPAPLRRPDPGRNRHPQQMHLRARDR